MPSAHRNDYYQRTKHAAAEHDSIKGNLSENWFILIILEILEIPELLRRDLAFSTLPAKFNELIRIFDEMEKV